VHSFRYVADRAAVKLCAERPVNLDDDESDVTSIEDASIANNASREASPCTSLSTLLSPENGLEGDEIFEESLCPLLIVSKLLDDFYAAETTISQRQRAGLVRPGGVPFATIGLVMHCPSQNRSC
jgi:hypothetical protein